MTNVFDLVALISPPISRLLKATRRTGTPETAASEVQN